MKNKSTVQKIITMYESKQEELTDTQFASLYLYTLATSLSFDQIAQNEIDNQIGDDNENKN